MKKSFLKTAAVILVASFMVSGAFAASKKTKKEAKNFLFFIRNFLFVVRIFIEDMKSSFIRVTFYVLVLLEYIF